MDAHPLILLAVASEVTPWAVIILIGGAVAWVSKAYRLDMNKRHEEGVERERQLVQALTLATDVLGRIEEVMAKCEIRYPSSGRPPRE